MTVLALDAHRRGRTWSLFAEWAAERGEAVGCPDALGRPQVLASVRLITECGSCGLRLPEDHRCTTPQETPHD